METSLLCDNVTQLVNIRRARQCYSPGDAVLDFVATFDISYQLINLVTRHHLPSIFQICRLVGSSIEFFQTDWQATETKQSNNASLGITLMSHKLQIQKHCVNKLISHGA